ncbi:MAG: penicillin acylase family protein, partial [Cyclobacteriaceae bacterium]
MKLLRKILLGLLVLLLVIVGASYLFLNQTKPQYAGELKLAGLESEVEVLFDTYGVPHIYAENETDLYYALGYVHAQDRLFQMEMLRRVAGGRLAEILGPELLDADRFFRTLGFNQSAEQSAAQYFSTRDQPYQIMAQAYLDGVNTFIENGPTPPEFKIIGIPKEPFVPADLYRIAGYMSFGFNAAFRTDPLMSRIATKWGPEYLEDLALNTLPDNTMIPTYNSSDSASISALMHTAQRALSKVPVPLWEGSNSWVVAPSRTKSGKVIFANDTHIGFSQPAVWYEAHLECPGFSFYGNHLAGFPFALIGHNRFASWGLTIFPNDDMDFYREKENPDNPDEVMGINGWEPLEKRQETIKVKGEADHILEVKVSRHGPIINQINEQVEASEPDPIAFWWSYFSFPGKMLQTTYQFCHGNHIDQYREAASWIHGPGLNVMYGDRDGNIAW